MDAKESAVGALGGWRAALLVPLVKVAMAACLIDSAAVGSDGFWARVLPSRLLRVCLFFLSRLRGRSLGTTTQTNRQTDRRRDGETDRWTDST